MGRGIYTQIQPFSLQDGPGTRTTVFLKGCSLRCWWCHNPETQSPSQEIFYKARQCIHCGACADACARSSDGKIALHTDRCLSCGACADACYAGALTRVGQLIDAEELTSLLLQDRALYDTSGGGVTLSGGEPLMQPEFVCEVLDRLRESDIHTAVETALNVPESVVEAILPRVDLIIADIKCVTDSTHRSGTGVSNERILQNIRLASNGARRMLLRTPIVPGFNEDPDELTQIARFVSALRKPPEIELLPYHGLCIGKYESLARSFRGAGLEEPTEDRMQHWARIMTEHGLNATYRREDRL